MIKIRSKLKFISTEDGGRRTPLFNVTNETPYRPNLVFGFLGSLSDLKRDGYYKFDDDNWSDSYKSIDGSIQPGVEQVLPGMTIEAKISIRDTNYIDNFLRENETFLVREGGRVIATGEVLSILEKPSMHN